MLTIGIDFDNTIVDYNAAFYRLACEKKLIPDSFLPNKIDIRNYLRRIGREEDWTEMQGIVYGSRMQDAVAFPGAIDFISDKINHGHRIYIISHKTRYPFRGEQYDLHQAATDWIKKNLIIPTENVFFEITKNEKINRVQLSQCDVFIDDLPEIFENEQFPADIKKILFDSDRYHSHFNQKNSIVCTSWQEVSRCLNLN
jgi:hypothetical protein